MQAGTLGEWSFAAAQTDVALVTVGASQQVVVSYAKATVGNSATGDVSCRIGFATATLPTVTTDSATPTPGVFLSHAGIAHGGGELSEIAAAGGAAGALGEDIRMTCSAATGSFLRIVMIYSLLTIDPGT